MPTQARRGTWAPRARAISAAQTGWVATRAVDEATDVNRSDGIQVAKCAPSSSPDATDSRHSPPGRGRSSSPRRRHSTNGAVAPAPSRHRQKAMARAGAAVAAMIGPEVEMKTTATARSSTSPGGGRRTAAGEPYAAAGTATSNRPAPLHSVDPASLGTTAPDGERGGLRGLADVDDVGLGRRRDRHRHVPVGEAQPTRARSSAPGAADRARRRSRPTACRRCRPPASRSSRWGSRR